jgi:hypothetical protein
MSASGGYLDKIPVVEKFSQHCRLSSEGKAKPELVAFSKKGFKKTRGLTSLTIVPPAIELHVFSAPYISGSQRQNQNLFSTAPASLFKRGPPVH